MLFLDADAYKAVDDLTHLTDIVKRHLEQGSIYRSSNIL